ncbi:restriction endonuclease subunit S [Oxalobacteraceae sp. CFBP 8761]|nr:restriction endonuclease subunit S [Oxalobacteraceae sp. CFBP 8761]
MMMKDFKTGLVPQLRFPEFRDAQAWEKTTIGEIGNFHYGKSAPKWSLAADAPTPCVRYGELYTKFGAVITETASRTNIDPSNLRFSKGGEILVPRVGEKPEDFGKCCSYLPLANVAIGEMISVFQTKEIPLFYTYYFRHLYKQFAKVVEGQNVKNLYYAELEPLTIFRPSRAEQQKIADCLGSLDELITVQRHKVDALKTYKRGLMQQLLPHEGETVPRLRFPEFTGLSSWHSKKIGSLMSKASFAVSVEPEKMYREIGIRSHGKGIFHKVPVLGKVIGEKRVFKVVQDALVLNIVFAWEQAVATTSEKETEMIASHRFPMYVAKPGKCDVEYIKNFFVTKEGKRLLGMASPGGAGRNKTLGQKEFEKLEVVLPVSVNEQVQIANCLSSLDTKITFEADQLEALKAHRMGIMQQLFPAPEEGEA